MTVNDVRTFLLSGLVALAGVGGAHAAIAETLDMQEVHITMPDGVRLAADLYLPERESADQVFPVLLEYLPYRKTESRARNHRLYSYFVEHGYAVARVDIRGTGNSEGRLIPYEYSDIELDDGEAVIEWLASQPWSSGKVGMFGISWGGFNSIQLAARNPPALKAIIPIHATEDLYHDDVHYIDGIMHVDSWEMSQDLYNAMPGAPDYVIDEDYFRDRFDTEPWMLTYKSQQRDGPFWDRASTRDSYEKIRIPSFHISGWYDGYRDSVPRMLANVTAPVKGMIGPWSHAFPHAPWPNPGMEWRHEAVRFFDQWLKGVDTGIMDEPAFAVYVRDWHAPDSALDYIDGRWRWEDGWPVERTEHRTLFAQPDHGLSSEAPQPVSHLLRYEPSSGVEAGGPVMWWGDIAPDQRPTDAFSLVYDSGPLDEDVEILGFPQALLTVSADAPHANWYVRLSDVAQDGRVTLVSGAGFNGTHRNSARDPDPLDPGEPFDLDIDMRFTSWTFPAGHRIRLSISNAQWPMFWPTPYPMTTRLQLGGDTGSRLRLPVIPPGPETAPDFLPPAESPSLPGYRTIDSGNPSGYGEISSVTRYPPTGDAAAVATNTGGTEYPWGTETYLEAIEHRTSDRAPENTSMRGTHEVEVTLEDRVLRWEAVLDFTSDLENFHYSYTRRLLKDGELVREKQWDRTIPRDFQ